MLARTGPPAAIVGRETAPDEAAGELRCAGSFLEDGITTGIETRKVGGGRRSLETLAKLRISRFGPEYRASRSIGDLRWLPAQSYAIQRDQVREVWHAGHISALVSDDHVVVAGTQTGGLWLLTPVVMPHFRQGHQAVCLSDAWDSPNVTAMAYGPGGENEIFVGVDGGGALLLVQLESVLGGRTHLRTTSLPLPGTGAVAAIAVFSQPRRVVIADGFGVWWSPIPAQVDQISGYVWQLAENLPILICSGLAPGPGESVVAAAFGTGSDGGLHRGVWQSGVLRFSPSTITGATATDMRRTSVASCESQRQRMYAVAAKADDTIHSVLASSDGGVNWRAVTVPPGHGNQGFYNNCIAVSPYRPGVVALGWRSGGTYFSPDGGVNWQQPFNDVTNDHLHSDLHALYFARNSANADRLYVGSDGGIVSTRDLGQTFSSQFGRPLGNLQFYGGMLSASSRFPGLVAGGTQDNGNIFLVPDHDTGSAWHTLEGGDGGIVRFVDALGALLRFNNTLVVNNVEIGNRLRIAFWDPTSRTFGADWGTVLPVDGNAAGLTPTSVEIVEAPEWSRNGQLMYAVAASIGTVYGIFANGDGTGAALIGVASVPVEGQEMVTALGSYDGRSVLAGTSAGRLLLIDSATGVATAQTLPATATPGGVTRIERFIRSSFLQVLRVRPVETYVLRGGGILHHDGSAWADLGGRWLTFALDREAGRLFAANDSDVFQSVDGGVTWTDASQGLPARPHCSDLRIAVNEKGGKDLFLGTYGRSVWRAPVVAAPPKEGGPDLPPLVADVLFGVLGDGGGVIRVGGRLIRVPPYPPIRDLLVAIAVDEVARSMSPPHANILRGAVLERIAAIALEAKERLR